MLKPNKKKNNGPMKVLNAPIHLGSMVDNLESNISDIKSIWVMQRDDSLVRRTLLIIQMSVTKLPIFRKSMPKS